MQLGAAEGRVQLGGSNGAVLPLDLDRELREWALVARTVVQHGDESDREMLRRRGRLLAARLAHAQGEPVEYVDPVTGDVEPIRVPRPRSVSVDPPSPAAGTPAAVTAPAPARPVSRRAVPARTGAHAEPTPWATGLTVTACLAVLVAITDITLSRAFAAEFGWLWLPVNLVVGAGLAPSIWLVRGTAFWRWIGYGATTGLVIAWVCMLLNAAL